MGIFDNEREAIESLNESLFEDTIQAELDGYENEFSIVCYNGVAIGDDGTTKVILHYPRLTNATEEQKKEAVHYRTSSYEHWEECSVGDLMIRFGEVIYSEPLNNTI